MHRYISALVETAASLATACAFAQASTSGRPVHFLVGYPPGGGTDFTARLVAPLLAERLGQPVIVENRVGAAGNIAMEAVAKAEPDGLTIALGVSGMTINATLQPDLRFHPLKDFAPVIRLVNNPLVMVANPSHPAKDIASLIRMAKERPGAMNYGTPGAGTGMHMMGELLKTEAGINVVHVPYKGNGPLVNDLLGNHISVGIADLASTRTFIKEGRLHALAVGAPNRTELAPDIPTVAESGLPGFSVLSWTGVVAPAATPAATVETYNRHIRAILQTPEVRAKLLAAGLEPAPTSVAEFREIIRSDIEKWAKVIKAAGIKLER
jgi:tripartite-type tricarboxylate transporter receptor subunit TctC